jgi:hypothetical protein
MSLSSHPPCATTTEQGRAQFQDYGFSTAKAQVEKKTQAPPTVPQQ